MLTILHPQTEASAKQHVVKHAGVTVDILEKLDLVGLTITEFLFEESGSPLSFVEDAQRRPRRLE